MNWDYILREYKEEGAKVKINKFCKKHGISIRRLRVQLAKANMLPNQIHKKHVHFAKKEQIIKAYKEFHCSRMIHEALGGSKKFIRSVLAEHFHECGKKINELPPIKPELQEEKEPEFYDENRYGTPEFKYEDVLKEVPAYLQIATAHAVKPVRTITGFYYVYYTRDRITGEPLVMARVHKKKPNTWFTKRFRLGKESEAARWVDEKLKELGKIPLNFT